MENQKLRRLAVFIENEEREDVVIIFAQPCIKDVQELIREESILKIVTDFISTENEADLEGVEKVTRKGEEVWLEMWERERFNKDVKKEETNREVVKMEILEKEIDTPLNLDQDIIKKNCELNENVEPFDFVDVLLYEDCPSNNQNFEEDKPIGFLERKKFKKHRKRPLGNTYSCDICSKVFAKKGFLSQHLKSHAKPFTCDKCGRTLSTKQSLEKHKETHSDNKSFSCDICNKVFSGIKLLASHKRVAHGEKKESCNICGKLFFDKVRLTVHLRVHTKERPFTCDICGKAFSQKPHLERHKRIHTGEKPHSCDICGKLFSVKDNLNVHKIELHNEHDNTQEHDRYICDVCKRPFANIHRLKRHKRTHSGEKPYSCDSGRVFAS